MLTRARAVALVLAGLMLAACGNIHPGDAAVVDGRSISMKSLDVTAKSYCELTLRSATQQGVSAVSNADMRRQAVTGMVTLMVARKLAEEQGVTPKPSTYELTDEQKSQVAAAFPKGDHDALNQVIEDSQETYEIAVALGERSTGDQRTDANVDTLAQAGQAQITKTFSDYDVSFSPRFGLSKSSKQIADTGSLSVPVSADKVAAAELPPAQRCS